MVTLNRLSVEDPQDKFPLLPEAVEEEVRTPAAYKQGDTAERDFFISRTENAVICLLLLVGCYAAILIPAYFPLHKFSLSDDQYLNHEDVLNHSASLLSGRCRRRWCMERLKQLPCSPALTDIPVFLQREGNATLWDEPPPLGLQGSQEHLARALASLPKPDLPRSLRREGRCTRCVVVGSGGVLHGSRLGSHIDQYDVIIRMNNAPVLGYETDTGSRTTIRLMYPEGAPSSANEYNETSIVALVVFKSLDLDWLTSIITKQPLGFWSKLWFWKDVVDDIPLKADNFRILHPEIFRRTGEVLQKYSHKQRKSMVPTLGAGVVVMALQLCDHVSLAGFGYNMQHPHAPLHYYETIHMAAMKAQVVHDVSSEKLFLRQLVAAGAVSDLTGAL
ncbi:ST3 beta-galactoside alpha-2,3-sialyltransferase 7 [Corythoichthys intestinalis]|uniref:ST3 beta-galactoside alpha-2,3-sialyltransferase 7 n=1 Tax=Corythoichthys intestinalis TaxID=161448 RepID=UPI0025A57A68|nr:ST3 beta-galactoside alpha-2,3-sialyltransferase 7 [Corythoichthys intestinalis]XP_061794568.1 lactosylceramide alpha-2,3-sialyltransferase-like [Nerophis lumbriciformis]